MGYCFTEAAFNQVLKELSQKHTIYAPKLFPHGGSFSDTDSIRYGEIHTTAEIDFEHKTAFSFKEVLLPLSETLFFFTEDATKEAAPPPKSAIILLRSCDLHAVKRLDTIYLQNGCQDYYYQRVREKTKFILLGCQQSFANCFCVDMGTNKSNDYDSYLESKNGKIYIDNKTPAWEELFAAHSNETTTVMPAAVSSNEVHVQIPANLTPEVMHAKMWDEYNTRCIDCGRCNFVCPTCTCFTMQDIFYTDNGKAGERRRVWASCMVDGFTNVAGGSSYRSTNSQRMRFKVMHKIYDYQKRTGMHMCVGCGRCDDICPEYISFTNSINKLDAAMKEVTANASK